jgi:hypothetical protein
MQSAPVLADVVIDRTTGGGYVAETVKTTKIIAKAQGAGCLTVEELTLGYKNFEVLKHLMGTGRCGIIEVGDTLELVDGSHVKGKPLVKIYAGHGEFMYTPGYIFGFK